MLPALSWMWRLLKHTFVSKKYSEQHLRGQWRDNIKVRAVKCGPTKLMPVTGLIDGARGCFFVGRLRTECFSKRCWRDKNPFNIADTRQILLLNKNWIDRRPICITFYRIWRCYKGIYTFYLWVFRCVCVFVTHLNMCVCESGIIRDTFPESIMQKLVIAKCIVMHELCCLFC